MVIAGLRSAGLWRSMMIAALSCVSAWPVLASSSGILRNLSATTYRSCPAPQKLKERYTVYSTPYEERVEIACLKTPNDASWVLYAAPPCRHDRCGPLAYPTEHAGPGPDAYGSPRVVTYVVSTIMAGAACSLKGSIPGGVFWACKSRRTVVRRAPLKITTTGDTISTDDHKDGDAVLPYDVEDKVH